MIVDISKKPWWDYLEQDLRELLLESLILLGRVKTWDEKFSDYAFVVFASAKAYEGFLKKFFLDLDMITEEDYFGKRFRVGKALNPQLEKRFRDESVYDKLAKHCGGTDLPEKLWNTWKRSRNLLFHWFPDEKNAVSLEEAEERITMIIEAIDEGFKECRHETR